MLRLFAPALCAGRPDLLPGLWPARPERYGRSDRRARSYVACRLAVVRALPGAPAAVTEPRARCAARAPQRTPQARLQSSIPEWPSVRILDTGIPPRYRFLAARFYSGR